MKILLFGGNGMAGHVIRTHLAEGGRHEVYFTQRKAASDPRALVLDVMDHDAVQKALDCVRPDAVINATGILNEEAARRPVEAIAVNSLFPHQLARLGEQMGFRLIHISTDCVFSGKRGNYTEQDPADGTSAYARTKILGEVTYGGHLTIRTSIIGPERRDGIGLFHWFMKQDGEIRGFRRVYWNGVTTLELAQAIEWVLERPITGLVHLACPEKVSKYDLLLMLKEVFGRPVTVRPWDEEVSDKSLVNTRTDFVYRPSPYREALVRMREWIRSHPGYHYPLP